MVQRELRTETRACPECGQKLTHERDMFLCREHGAFFAYGPQLLVRAPGTVVRASEIALPWENPRARTS